MKKWTIGLVLAVTLILTGCSPIETTARDGIAGAKGYIDSTAAKHAECNTDPSGQACVLVTKGNAAKHLAIDALEEYCTSPAFEAGTGPCSPPTDKTQKDQLQSKLAGAMTNLNQIINDIKALK